MMTGYSSWNGYRRLKGQKKAELFMVLKKGDDDRGI